MAVSNKYIKLQQIKFDLFKSQDPEIGRYDVIFELQGKQLYAHKTMLNLVSDTFDSMLSDRWTSKDQPIKLKDYTFEEFYQFLTFLYSAKCKLTDENIVSMIDIAEFYHVDLLKEYCEEYLSNRTFTTENILQYSELAEKYSLIQLKATVENFITKNFLSLTDSEHFMNLNKSAVKQFVIVYKEKVKPEAMFQAAYKWTENQVLANELTDHLNKNDAIKSEISDFLPYIDFSVMEMSFLLHIVVPRGFVFSSYDELSKILCSGYSKNRVTVTNTGGQKLYGFLPPDYNLIQTLKTLYLSGNARSAHLCFWKANFQIPPTSNPLQKRDDVKWYLTYLKSGYICVTPRQEVFDDLYLLAEMMPEEGKSFDVTKNCVLKIE